MKNFVFQQNGTERQLNGTFGDINPNNIMYKKKRSP